jgi:hypothetical protein
MHLVSAKAYGVVNILDLGIYEAGCGMDKLMYAFGHDEYLYQLLVSPMIVIVIGNHSKSMSMNTACAICELGPHIYTLYLNTCIYACVYLRCMYACL